MTTEMTTGLPDSEKLDLKRPNKFLPKYNQILLVIYLLARSSKLNSWFTENAPIERQRWQRETLFGITTVASVYGHFKIEDSDCVSSFLGINGKITKLLTCVFGAYSSPCGSSC